VSVDVDVDHVTQVQLPTAAGLQLIAPEDFVPHSQ